MNFEDLDFNDLDELSVQHLIFDTKELTYILKGHLFIERIIEALIRKNIKNPEVLFKQQLSFSLKLNLAISLGLITQKYVTPIKALNKLRNQYAHDGNYNVTVKELLQLKYHWEPIQKKAFETAVKKGIEDATMIATLFLCWACIHLLN